MRPKATITVGGMNLEGWTTVSVARSMKQAAATFDLAVIEKDGAAIPDAFSKPMPGDPCAVFLDGALAVTGYVDARNAAFAPEQRGIRITGRSKTADLVDSSIVENPGEFRNATPAQVIRQVAGRYGISVVEKGEAGKPRPRIQVFPGETPLEMIDRLTRFEAVAPYDDPQGNLVLGRMDLAAAPVAALVEGGNIKAASATLRADTRHSEVIVKGQKPATDDAWGADANELIARVRDDAVTRYRPLLIVNEEPGELEDLRKRADWEAARRGSESVSVSVTVQGWRHSGGALWTPGDVYTVMSPTIPVARALVAESVVWSQDDTGGTVTDITLVPPETYTPEPGSADQPSSGRAAARRRSGGAGRTGRAIENDAIWTEAKPTERAR